MPRRYTLGKRADDQAATRARIVSAAVELCRTGGLGAVTVNAVAATADVAPGTVRNHFTPIGALHDALGAAILDEIGMPGPAIFTGLASTPDRLRRLTTELDAFFRRSEGWWQVYSGDRSATASGFWSLAEARFERSMTELVAVAIEPTTADPAALAVASMLLSGRTHYELRGRGLSADAAFAAVIELLVPWLEDRGRGTMDGDGRPPQSRRRA